MLWFSQWNSRLPALHRMARIGDINKVRSLLQSDPTMLKYMDDIENSTVLYMAVISGSRDLVESLIEMGTDINCVTKQGWC